MRKILPRFHFCSNDIVPVFFGKCSRFCVVACLLSAQLLWAQTPDPNNAPDIQPFTSTDSLYLNNQTRYARQLVYDYLLTYLRDDREHDLALIQQLLDSGKIQVHERRELQALGAVLGEYLASQHRLEWVIYSDQLGRSRALHIDDTGKVLFPMSMISRRYEVGSQVSVADIYAQAEKVVKRVRENAALYQR